MNWDVWLEEYNGSEYSNVSYEAAKLAKNYRLASRIDKNRQISERALKATRQAYEENPCASDEQLRTRAKEIAYSSILALILSALIYAAISKAIEYFIKRIRESNTSSCNCS